MLSKSPIWIVSSTILQLTEIILSEQKQLQPLGCWEPEVFGAVPFSLQWVLSCPRQELNSQPHLCWARGYARQQVWTTDSNQFPQCSQFSFHSTEKVLYLIMCDYVICVSVSISLQTLEACDNLLKTWQQRPNERLSEPLCREVAVLWIADRNFIVKKVM